MRIFTLLFPFFIFYLINNSAGTSNNGNILEETKSSSSEEENIADGNSVDENENRQDSTFPWTFKNFEQLTSTNETWPTTGFYRFMSICQEETAPFNLYKQEGQQCPHGTPVAIGRYRNAQNETGWGIIEVETFAPFPQHVQAYAAGLVEGALTKVQIFNHYRNTVQGMCDNNATEYCTRLFRYLNANLQWIQSQVNLKPQNDLYWRHVNLTFIQLTGINDGYMSNKIGGYTPHSSFKISPVFLLQLLGEFYDLEIALGKKTAKRGAGHCSALIKVTDGNKDLLVAHNTMAGYNQMNRMVKLYKFGYDKKEVPGNTVSFSGYPAVLASQDDFTLTSAKLVSIETTISIFNASLYQLYLKPVGQLQCWIRSYISNQLAATAHDWVKIFAQYNSGTYNNQWTVVDYKLFKPGKELPNANLVWILEQVPGTCVSRDLTWFLRKYGYWPSYNIPYLNKISQLSGYNHQGNLNNWWRWGHSPRARIFQRDQSKVDGMPALQALLRYNDFKHDEFSRCNCSPPYTADASIATRGDLNPPNGHWELPDEQGYHNFGSLDYKGTNYELANKLRFELIGGPTYGGPGNLPIFSWATTQLKVPHFGQKTEWNFESFVTLWQKSTNTN